jgi:hypothetical protein
MSKINNKSIILGLGILAIFAFGLIAFTPTETKAYYEFTPLIYYPVNETTPNPYPASNYYYPYSTSPYANPSSYYYTTPTPINNYTTPVYTTPTPIEGCGERTTGFSTTTGQSCVGNYVAPTPKTTSTVKTTPTTTSTDENTFSGLTANALFGSNGFMPSGLVQWIFFIILIAAIIFLWRYVYGEEKYRAEPMKHA